MVQIRRIKREEARQVCFSKRWAELFKKTRELAILCGLEVAAVTISPTGKALSFGYPSAEAVLDRFAPTGVGCGGGAGAEEDNGQLVELIREYRELRAVLDADKARKERAKTAMAKDRTAENQFAAWLDADISEMGREELMAYDAALAKMQAVIERESKVRSSNNNQVQVQPPSQQQFLGNNGVKFVDKFDAGSSGNNSGADSAAGGDDHGDAAADVPLPAGDDAAAVCGFPGPY